MLLTCILASFLLFPLVSTRASSPIWSLNFDLANIISSSITSKYLCTIANSRSHTLTLTRFAVFYHFLFLIFFFCSVLIFEHMHEQGLQCKQNIKYVHMYVCMEEVVDSRLSVFYLIHLHDPKTLGMYQPGKQFSLYSLFFISEFKIPERMIFLQKKRNILNYFSTTIVANYYKDFLVSLSHRRQSNIMSFFSTFFNW